MPHESWYGYTGQAPVQTKPTCANGVVIESTKSSNSFLRVGTTLTRENRMYIQTIEGAIYGAPFYLEKTGANSVALTIMEQGYEDDGSEAATLEARAMELLRQAQKKRQEEKERLEKRDVEVAEYRKTELMGSSVTASSFVEWENLQEDTKKDWRERYAAVLELFKGKFNVEFDEDWRPVKLSEIEEGDELRVKSGFGGAWKHQTARYQTVTGSWVTDVGTVSADNIYLVIERRVK